ncbi:MAG: 1,4-beta-N-acetylmuramidase [Ruminococcaceae bacterium]|nr:1,4-beta-N-acetylmuramidase [Oscillospiraceae bacterium]
MKQFGIDISRWQGNFNFNSALKDGISFAIIKGGGGDDGLYTDVMFEKNYKKAKEHNIPVGAYWFSKALSVDEAIVEADYFFENILKNKEFELPIFIDVEHNDMLNLGKELLTDVIKAWCNHLEKKGFFVGIYSSVHAFSAYMNDKELESYIHWVAQWSDECTYKNKDILGFWQFGGDTNLLRSNIVAGVVCDQNYMYFDFPKIIKQKGLNGFVSESDDGVDVSVPPIKSAEEIAREVIQGKWGNGTDRKNKLTDAGYDYDTIQSAVDNILTKKTVSSENNTIKAGDLAKMSTDALVYGTDSKFASFVYKNLLYVRELNGNRAVISTLPEGPITGAVDVKYLTKYNP